LRHFSDAPIVLAGTKLDLRNNEAILNRLEQRKERPITSEEGHELVTTLKLDAFVG
jgi:GTPase SAR1 family protein